MSLNIVPRSLQYFEQVAQLGSIQAASRDLGISASAILRQITALEADIGTAVFERHAKGMTLTSTGYELLELARNWRLDSARLWSEIQADRGVVHGNIRIAAMDGMVNGVIPELIQDVTAQLPGVHISITVTSPANAVKEVLNGDVDLAAVANVPPHDNLWSHWRRDFPLGCIVSPTHPLVDREHLQLRDLTDHPIVFQDASLSIRKLLEASHGWIFEQAKAAVVVNSIQLMKHLVASQQYLAITSEMDASPELKSGQLKFIPLSDADAFRQSFSIISNLQMPVSSVMSQVVARMIELFDQKT